MDKGVLAEILRGPVPRAGLQNEGTRNTSGAGRKFALVGSAQPWRGFIESRWARLSSPNGCRRLAGSGEVLGRYRGAQKGVPLLAALTPICAAYEDAGFWPQGG